MRNLPPLLALALLFLAALPAAAQRVYVDYDQATPFSEYRTFEFRDSESDLRRAGLGLHRPVSERIRELARSGGLEEVAENPDLYITYYVAIGRELDLALNDLGYAYGPGFTPGEYWSGGVGQRTTTGYKFKQGTLIIDVWDAGRSELVWRGIGSQAISPKKPEKNEKRLFKSIDKIIEKWSEMHGARARAIREMKIEQEKEQGQ
jgi:hypothetical protein